MDKSGAAKADKAEKAEKAEKTDKANKKDKGDKKDKKKKDKEKDRKAKDVPEMDPAPFSGFIFEEDEEVDAEELTREREETVNKKKGGEKRNKNKHSKETTKILQSAKVVEERLKGREQVCLTILTIELSDLPPAHRFTRNQPWLKAVCGPYSWVADHEEAEDGANATFKNLRWLFNIERNERDRSDLVITVCSKNLIIGRYVLGKEEFSGVPDLESGFFEVTGGVNSGLGPAGTCRVMVQKGIAERPRGPVRDSQVNRNAPNFDSGMLILGNSVILENKTGNLGGGLGGDLEGVGTGTLGNGTVAISQMKHMTLLSQRLNVKILSAAVMDLKAAHFLDANSPFVAVEAGEWVGVSDVAHHAGIAARWNSLNWKFPIEESGLRLSIHSKNVKVGQMAISLAEVAGAVPRPNGVLEFVKHLTNGREITGKAKVNLLAEHPDTQLTRSILPDGTLQTLKTIDGSPPMPISPAAFMDQGVMVICKVPIKFPFLLNISEVTLLDTVKIHILRENSLSLNVVSGSSGRATEEIKGSGRYAHWIDLRWKIQVRGQHQVRITSWSKGVSIGSATLTAPHLLQMPSDVENNLEVFATLLCPLGRIMGKVKLHCRLEQLPDPVSVTTTSEVLAKGKLGSPENLGTPQGRLSPLDTRGFVGEGMSEEVLRVGEGYEGGNGGEGGGEGKDSFHGNNGKNDFDDPGDLGEDVYRFGQHREELVLPMRATVLRVSVVDIAPAHVLRRNLPVLTLSCDRKSATTSVSDTASTANWTVKWPIIVRVDSFIVLHLRSRDIPIGRVEIKPSDLLKIPHNDSMEVEFKTQFMSEGDTSTARLHLVIKLEKWGEGEIVGGALFAQGRLGYGGVSVYDSHLGAQRVPSPPSGARVDTSFITGGMGALGEKDEEEGWDRGHWAAGVPGSAGPGPGNRTFNGSLSYMGTDPFAPLGYTDSQVPQMIFDRNMVSAENARKLDLNFSLSVAEVDLMGMRKMHRYGKNCPYLSAACGKWTAVTEALVDAGEAGYWTNLRWRFSIKGSGMVRLVVTSKSLLLGAVSFSSAQLLDAVSDDKGLRRMVGDVASEGRVNGRLKIAYTLDVQRIQSPSPTRDAISTRNSYCQGNGVGGSNVGGMGGMGSCIGDVSMGNMVTDSILSQFGGGGGYSPAQRQSFSPQSFSLPQNRDFGYHGIEEDSYDDHNLMLHIIEMSTLDLTSAHKLKRNLPRVQVSCDTFYFYTKNPPADYSDLVNFRKLGWIFPVTEKSMCKITVDSRGYDIGTAVVDLQVLRNVPFDKMGNRETVLLLENSGRQMGKVRVCYIIESSMGPEQGHAQGMGQGMGKSGRYPGMSLPQLSSKETFSGSRAGSVKPTISRVKSASKEERSSRGEGGRETGTSGDSVGMSGMGMGGGSVDSMGDMGVVVRAGGGSVKGDGAPSAVATYGRDFEYLLSTQDGDRPVPAPMVLTITGLACIDLTAAHNLVPNSPIVNLACGKVVATTKVAERAGKLANWENLSISMRIDDSSQLRVLVSSQGTAIGGLTLNRQKLLSGRQNQRGYYVLFAELEKSNGKPAGKIKFVYTLEEEV